MWKDAAVRRHGANGKPDEPGAAARTLIGDAIRQIGVQCSKQFAIAGTAIAAGDVADVMRFTDHVEAIDGRSAQVSEAAAIAAVIADNEGRWLRLRLMRGGRRCARADRRRAVGQHRRKRDDQYDLQCDARQPMISPETHFDMNDLGTQPP